MDMDGGAVPVIGVQSVPLDSISKKDGDVCYHNMFTNSDLRLKNAGVLITAKRQKLPISVVLHMKEGDKIAHHWSVKIPERNTAAFKTWGKVFINLVIKRRRRKTDPRKEGFTLSSVALWGRKEDSAPNEPEEAELVVYPDQGAAEPILAGELIGRDDSLDSSSALLAMEAQNNASSSSCTVRCKSCWGEVDTHLSEKDLLEDEITASEAELAMFVAKRSGACAEAARWLCSAYEFKLIRLLQRDPRAYLLLHLMSIEDLFRAKYESQATIVELLRPMTGMGTLHLFVRDLVDRPPSLGRTIISVRALETADNGTLAIIGAAMSSLEHDVALPAYTLGCLLMIGTQKSVAQNSTAHVDMRLTRDSNGTPVFGKGGEEEDWDNFIHTYEKPVLYQTRIAPTLQKLTLGPQQGVCSGIGRLFVALGLNPPQKAETFLALSSRLPRLGARYIMNQIGTVLPLAPIACDLTSTKHVPPVDPAFVFMSNAGFLTTHAGIERSSDIAFAIEARASIPPANRLGVIVDDPTMTKSQKEQAKLLRDSHICFMSGPAGTGKTTGICKALCRFPGTLYVISDTNVAATTLANQLQAAIDQCCQDGNSPTTIVRRVTHWMHESAKRVEITQADGVILDETSTCSLQTIGLLLSLLNPTCFFAMCGDPAQKSPISKGGNAGMFFRDLVKNNAIPGIRMEPLNIRASDAPLMAKNLLALRTSILVQPKDQKEKLENVWDYSIESNMTFAHIDSVKGVFYDMKERFGQDIVPPPGCDVQQWALHSPAANSVVISQLNRYISPVNRDMFLQTSNARPKLKIHKPFDIFIPGVILMITKPVMWFIDENGVIGDNGKKKNVRFPVKTRLIVISAPRTKADTEVVKVMVLVNKKLYSMFVKRFEMKAVKSPFELGWAIGTMQAQSTTFSGVVFGIIAPSSFSPLQTGAEGVYSLFSRSGNSVRILLLPQGKDRNGVPRGHSWANYRSFVKHLGQRSKHRPITLLDIMLSKQRVRVGLGSVYTLGYVARVTALIHLAFARETLTDKWGVMHCGSWVSRTITAYMFAIPITRNWRGAWDFTEDDEHSVDFSFESIADFRKQERKRLDADFEEIEDLTILNHEDDDDDLFALMDGPVVGPMCSVDMLLPDDDALFAEMDEIKTTGTKRVTPIVSIDSDQFVKRKRLRLSEKRAKTNSVFHSKQNVSVTEPSKAPALGNVNFGTFFSDLMTLN